MYKFLSRVVIILLIFMMSLAFMKSAMQTSDIFKDSEVLYLLNERWRKTADIENGDQYCEYEYTVPIVSNDRLILSIESFWSNLQIFFNNKELTYITDKYHEFGSSRYWINLPENSGTLSIRTDSSDLYLRHVIDKKTYVGTHTAVFKEFFFDNLFALIFGLFSLICGITIMLFGILIKKHSQNNLKTDILYLCIFILLVGIWVVTDSCILQLFTSNTSMIVLTSFLSFLTMPIFLICFVKKLLIQKSKLLKIINLLFILNMAAFLIIYIFRLTKMYKVLFLHHLLIFTSIVLIIINCINDIKRFGNNEIKPILIGFGLLSIFSAAAIICFWINPSINYSALYMIGIMLFVFCLIYITIKKLRLQIELNINSKIYRELAYKDLMTQMYNRTAFITVQNDKTIVLDRAFIMFDINRLKQTNDRYGHHAGDKLIIEAAKCILDIFDNIGKCYRIGGDEFAVMLDGLSVKKIQTKLTSLEERIKEANINRKIPIEITYGYAIQNGRKLSNDSLYKEADKNMYVNKTKIL